MTAFLISYISLPEMQGTSRSQNRTVHSEQQCRKTPYKTLWTLVNSSLSMLHARTSLELAQYRKHTCGHWNRTPLHHSTDPKSLHRRTSSCPEHWDVWLCSYLAALLTRSIGNACGCVTAGQFGKPPPPLSGKRRCAGALDPVLAFASSKSRDDVSIWLVLMFVMGYGRRCCHHDSLSCCAQSCSYGYWTHCLF